MALTLPASTIAAFGLPHRIRRTINLLDLDHNLILSGLENAYVDGQVNVDSAAEVSRSATVTFFDPRRRLALDYDNPAAGDVSPKYLLELKRGIYDDVLGAWVDIPLGVLWANRSTRDGALLTVEAQGKEALLRYPFTYSNSAPLQPYTIPAGTNKISAIQDLLELAGETRIRLTESDAVMLAALTLTTDTSIWQVCQIIAASMGWILFYDAEGYVVCRPFMETSDQEALCVYSFSDGDGGVIRTIGEVGHGADSLLNAVIASGATPAGTSAPLRATAHVPAGDPLDLIRGGVRLWLPGVVTNDAAKSQAATASVANTSLAQIRLSSVEMEFTSSPVWHLEEGDPYWFSSQTDGFETVARWTRASIPLGVGAQSNGYLRRVGYRHRANQLRSLAA